LEGLVIFINGKVYGGYKSGITGIDLEFDHEGVRYIVTIKSWPNWGNSSQIRKMISDFKTAKRILRTSNSQLNVVAVNGCCYGRDKNPDKGDYFKYCGQLFWEFISGDAELYTEIIEPLGYKAKEKNEEFLKSSSQMINKFTREFSMNSAKKMEKLIGKNWYVLIRQKQILQLHYKFFNCCNFADRWLPSNFFFSVILSFLNNQLNIENFIIILHFC
jgi:hypothetical protein